MTYLLAIFLLTSCAPDFKDLMGNGLNCKADIVTPHKWPKPNDVVSVEVKIHSCQRAP